MKRIMSLIMLVLMISTYSSQVINTNDTKCFSQPQLTEIYQGLKQGEYLKVRLVKTEELLKNSEILTQKQKEIIEKKDLVIDGKEQLINYKETIIKINREEFENEQTKLITQMEINKEKSKIKQKQKFWTGIGVGTSVGVLITTVIMVLLVK